MDLIALGECLVEFTRRNDGAWNAGFAGDAVNILVHASRLGRQCGFVSCVGNDLFTPLILDGLQREGIEIAQVRRLINHRNGLYFIENDASGEPAFHFWRTESAATTTLGDGDIGAIASYVSRARFMVITGVTLAVMKEVERMAELLSMARKSGTQIVLDSNYREALWNSRVEYRERINRVLPYTSIFLPSMSDIARAWNGREAEDLCSEWDAMGIDTIVVKNGANGALHFDGGCLVGIPPLPDAVVVDTTGAGDAFNAGFLSARIDDATVLDAIDAGQRSAVLILAVRGAFQR